MGLSTQTRKGTDKPLSAKINVSMCTPLETTRAPATIGSSMSRKLSNLPETMPWACALGTVAKPRAALPTQVAQAPRQAVQADAPKQACSQSRRGVAGLGMGLKP
jgi:hypothetical protein